MFNIKGKKVTILGGKRSGFALAQLVLAKGGIPKISEFSPESSMDEEFKKWVKENHCLTEFNGHTKSFVEDSDIVILSPGVKINSEPVTWAKDKGILVLGEIEFAFEFCQKPVIAVTGSNGKTTTVNLIYNVIKQAGYKVCLCGNVGTAFSKLVIDLSAVDYVVLEISSFQMESLLSQDSIYRQKNNKTGLFVKGFKPLIGVILNFTQNHLDRHKDLQEYFEAKSNIFLNQSAEDIAVLNFNDSWLRKLEGKIKSKIVYFDSPGQNKNGIKNPNCLAVLAVCQELGISVEDCLNVFENFKGVEHRMELVRTMDGIDFINDSKATTVEAGRWALNSIHKPILMICGGKDKESDFTVLKDLVHSKVKKMYLIGKDREKLRKVFAEVVSYEEFDSLEDAIKSARREAHKGESVILSPMCASFDMFRDYEHRGKVFKEIVNNLV